MRQKGLEKISKYDSDIHIYADASKSEKGCGVGIFDGATGRQISSKLKQNVTIMTAELSAAAFACQYIKFYQYNSAVIFTNK